MCYHNCVLHETVTKGVKLTCYNVSISADVYTCIAMTTHSYQLIIQVSSIVVSH